MAALPDRPEHAALTWRSLDARQVPAWHALVDAAGQADGAQERFTAEDLDEELAPAWIDLERDSTIGYDADGAARAFGVVQVRPGDTDLLRAHCWGVVHPAWRGRGIGRALIDWQQRRAQQVVAARRVQLDRPDVPGRAFLEVDERVVDAGRLAARAGFRPVRWYSQMSRDLALPVPAAEVPAGLVLVGYPDAAGRVADLEDRVRLAHNEAFADHWGFQPWTPELWQQWESGHRHFRPAWSFLVLDGDDIAGYALSAAYEQDWQAQGYREGWTGKLGVRRAWRGRGLARALLAASMTAFRASGMQRAGLDVDAENPTGAVRLYTSLGYEVVRRSAQWATSV